MGNEHLYERFEFTEEYKNDIIEMLRHNTNVEIGGHRLWDGQRTHLTQNPWELTDFIFELKNYEKERKVNFNSFLDIGYSSGITDSILNKFFLFNNIVGIDLFNYPINGDNFYGNISHKNILLISGDSKSKRVLDITEKMGPYDLIFIDADHSYDGVKSDFENYLVFLANKGVIGFHDIDNPDWPGVKIFWEELENTNKYDMQKFVKKGFSLQYGIGMLTKK